MVTKQSGFGRKKTDGNLRKRPFPQQRERQHATSLNFSPIQLFLNNREKHGSGALAPQPM